MLKQSPSQPSTPQQSQRQVNSSLTMNGDFDAMMSVPQPPSSVADSSQLDNDVKPDIRNLPISLKEERSEGKHESNGEIYPAERSENDDSSSMSVDHPIAVKSK